jgi:signal transduction histidine kinase
MAHYDKSKIQLVFLNILKNGAEAMFNIKTKGYHPHFILKSYKVSDMACIEIENNGLALDKKTQKRLFGPFYTTKPTEKGTGLGLSVSYFIIATDHNGKMAVESAPGGNTKFIIKLPF